MTTPIDLIREHLDVLERSVERTRADGEVEWRTVMSTTERIHSELARFEGVLVNFLRASGRSWTDIGDQLGVSRQAAWQRFHVAVDEAQAEADRLDRASS